MIDPAGLTAYVKAKAHSLVPTSMDDWIEKVAWTGSSNKALMYLHIVAILSWVGVLLFAMIKLYRRKGRF